MPDFRPENALSCNPPLIAGPHRAGAPQSRHLLQLGHARPQPEGRRGGEPAKLRSAAAEIHQHQVNWGHLLKDNFILTPCYASR